MNSEYTDLTADQLREYIRQHGEQEYILVDVRQPREYREKHIPGAHLLPLGELAARKAELPADREVIFYCRSGRRSAAAAVFWANTGQAGKTVYNLQGGILAFDGITVSDFPDLHVFDDSRSIGDLLYTAMDLEKGAWRFYSKVLEMDADLPYRAAIDLLSRAEEGHARLIYGFWVKYRQDPPPFPEVYDALNGEVLEGGQRLDALMDRLAMSEDPQVRILEMAIGIEHAAYDMYRSMAHQMSGTTMEQPFLAIADAEKEHMRIAADALSTCTPQKDIT